MPPAIIAGGIAAAGAVGGAAIASKGAKKAAQTTADSNAQSVALQERIYGQNQVALQPWQQSGQQANALLMDALGFNAGQPAAQAQVQPAVTNYYSGANPGAAPVNALAAFRGTGGQYPAGDAWQAWQRSLPTQQPAVTAATSGTPVNARGAFDTFLDSINYNWQLEQGLDAVNSGWAGSGMLQSGAAMRGINDYAQNMARGAYQDWYGGVENMANRGLGAASAQAGVGQNFANSVSNLNSANANALANLQIAKSNNTANLLGGLGQIGAYTAGQVLQPPGTVMSSMPSGGWGTPGIY